MPVQRTGGRLQNSRFQGVLPVEQHSIDATKLLQGHKADYDKDSFPVAMLHKRVFPGSLVMKRLLHINLQNEKIKSW